MLSSLRHASRLSTTSSLLPAALCIHGAGGGGWEYDLWRSSFEACGWRIVAPDLEPASGSLENTSLSDYVDQVALHWDEHQPSALVGASMGGALALLLAQRLEQPLPPIALVNSVIPRPWARGARREDNGSKQKSEGVLRWKGSSLESTVRALPDSTDEVQRWACANWRDESAAVMRELGSRTAPQAWATQPAQAGELLYVIGETDRDCPAVAQAEWAAAWGATTFRYQGMSHVGPLLGRDAPRVASDVVEWLALAHARRES